MLNWRMWDYEGSLYSKINTFPSLIRQLCLSTTRKIGISQILISARLPGYVSIRPCVSTWAVYFLFLISPLLEDDGSSYHPFAIYIWWTVSWNRYSSTQEASPSRSLPHFHGSNALWSRGKQTKRQTSVGPSTTRVIHEWCDKMGSRVKKRMDFVYQSTLFPHQHDPNPLQTMPKNWNSWACPAASRYSSVIKKDKQMRRTTTKDWSGGQINTEAGTGKEWHS